LVKEFLVNIGAGVALSAASWLLFQVLAPLYRAWRYKAPAIAGNWSYYDSEDNGASAVGAAVVKQRGEHLRADVTRTRSRSGKALSRTFRYMGRIRDGQVLLSFEEPVSNGFVSGNLVLKLSGDLKVLSGFTVYLDRDSGRVVAHPILFRRA
jgi:hypothetical protein